MLNLYQYALFYHKKCVALRPGDSRFWYALGICYVSHVPNAALEHILIVL